VRVGTRRAPPSRRRADRHGGLPPLGGPRPREKISAVSRPGRTGSSSARRRRGQRARFGVYGTASAASSIEGESDAGIDYSSLIPNNVTFTRTGGSSGPRGLAAEVSRVVAGHGTARLPGQETYLRTR